MVTDKTTSQSNGEGPSGKVPDDLEFLCYDDGIPQEIEKLLEDLYQSVYCVPEYFRLFKPLMAAKALVIKEPGSKTVHVFFYAVTGREAILLNELFDVGQLYLNHFTDYLFKKYPPVTSITLERIKDRPDGSFLPYRIWRTSEDIVIKLPPTLSEYRSSLGKHTKRNLSNYFNRLQRVYPDFRFEITRTERDHSELARKVIAMNRLRMESKRIRSGFDLDVEERVIGLCERYGFTGTIFLNGEVVAGTIVYQVGNHSFLEIVSHDPAYNNDRVGQVCLYLTIKEAIERGQKVFHLLWGKNEYKYLFLGEKHEIFSASIYRSKYHKACSLPRAIMTRLRFFALQQIPYWMNKYVLNPVPHGGTAGGIGG